MFVYLGVDKKSKIIKVGVTTSTPDLRLKNLNAIQDAFYFEPYYSKEFTDFSARQCEKFVLKKLRKLHDNPELDFGGKTETFCIEHDFETVVEDVKQLIDAFQETNQEEFERMKENFSKYVFDDFDKFVDMIGYLCGGWYRLPFEDRVTKDTLKMLFDDGMATTFVIACKKDSRDLLLDKYAREFFSRRTLSLPEGCRLKTMYDWVPEDLNSP